MKIYITANGQGERMQGISPLYKANLFYKGTRIIQHLIDNLYKQFNIYPEILSCHNIKAPNVSKIPSSSSRLETLKNVASPAGALIVDCDIYFDHLPNFPYFKTDFLYYFKSDSPKYGGLQASSDENGLSLISAKEKEENAIYRASGVYYTCNLEALLKRMEASPDSIAAAMPGARMIRETNFVRLGDVEDYKKAIGI